MNRVKNKPGLLLRIVIAIVLGVVLGQLLPPWVTRLFITFNSLFSEFLSFCIPLIILGLVTVAIADIGKNAGKMLLLTVVLAYGMTVFSGLLAYFTADTFFPPLIHAELPGQIVMGEDPAPFFSICIPPLMNVMTSLVLAFLLGLSLAAMPTGTLKQVAREFQEVILLTIRYVINPLLPLYILGIFINMSATGKVYSVLVAFVLIIGIIFVLHLLLLLFQYLLAGLVSRRNPLRLLRTMLPAYFTALGTQSSAATIPVTLEQTIKNGVDEDIAGFVVPLCATIHLSGSMMKIVCCAVALMIMVGHPYDLQALVGFIFMLAITMVAAPGVPGGAIMAALGVLSAMLGFDDNMQAMMIALYIAMDSFGTACNVTGDGALAVIVNTCSRHFRN